MQSGVSKEDYVHICKRTTLETAYEDAFIMSWWMNDNLLWKWSKWIKYDYKTICPKEHDANNPYWRIPENMDKVKYCPYCGKEIVIEE